MSRPALRVVASSPTPRPYRFDPDERGYQVLYRENEINHCPGCGHTNWYIGRRTAECAFCCTALPLSGEAAHG